MKKYIIILTVLLFSLSSCKVVDGVTEAFCNLYDIGVFILCCIPTGYFIYMCFFEKDGKK